MKVVYKLAGSNEEIKNWVESHGGTPAIIDDPEIATDSIGLSFSIMERKELVFMYSDSEDVNLTWAYKFVNKYATEE